MRLHSGRLAAQLTVAVLGLTACTSHGSVATTTTPATTSAAPVVTTTSASPTPTVTPKPKPKLVQLPFGGRQVLPKYRIIAYYGNGQSTALGVLGHWKDPNVAAQMVATEAAKWTTPTRPALPAMELIVTLVDGYAGSDGNYSHDSTPDEIQPYLTAARAHHELLILDIQPGRQNFLPVVKRYQQFLLQPDVGVALDSEWRMGPDQIPAKVIGHVDASEINDVTAYLSKLTVGHGLPQKVVVLHNFTGSMITNRANVKARPGLAIVWHFDGHGNRNSKLFGYNLLHVEKPFFNGFKLFLTEDPDIFQPNEVEALTPAPDFVSYQ